MPTLPQIGLAADELLQQLQVSREVDTTSPAWQEALRVAELLIGDGSQFSQLDRSACAERLRAAALTLQASQYSFEQVRDPNCPQSQMDGPALAHFGDLAAALLNMAETLQPDDLRPDAEVVDLDTRRH